MVPAIGCARLRDNESSSLKRATMVSASAEVVGENSGMKYDDML